MIKMFLLIGLGVALFVSCSSKRPYKVTITSIDPSTQETYEEVIEFKEKDDTSAFQRGHREYWYTKLAKLTVNKKIGIERPVPIHFEVQTLDDRFIRYEKTEAERLTTFMTGFVKTKMQEIDTITPIQAKPKPESANIY